MDKIIKTSAHFNNCAFHALMPYMVTFLSPQATNTPPFEFKEATPTLSQIASFKQTIGYRFFKEAFAEYYDISKWCSY